MTGVQTCALPISVVSTIGSVIFSFALSNVYSDPGLMSAVVAVCLHGISCLLMVLMLAMTGGCHEVTRSKEMGYGMSCDHTQSSDCLPYMVVRYFTCPFPLY